jgi:hypothetical protein
MADSPSPSTATIAREPAPVAPATVGSDRAATGRWRTLLLAGGAYLLLSLFVWAHVWLGHPTTSTTCGCGDSSLFTWFIEWPAYAISHGLNPLYSTAMFHPAGVNLLSNTGVVGIGILLAPVTWLFGPIASLNLALTLSPVLSALAMFLLLRRWVSWTPAAFIGGLFYGFSPFVLVSLTDAHLMLGMAAVPPLVVLCLDELLFRQRRPPVVTGVLLGLLVVVQFFIGTEVLAIMAIGAAIGLVLVFLYGARQRGTLRRQGRHAGIGLGAGAITAVVLLAYPVWFALAGPAHLSGPIWPKGVSPLFPYGIGFSGAAIREFVVPVGSVAPNWAHITRIIGAYQGPSRSDHYFGVGVVAVVLAGVVAWRRDRRLWLFAATAAISVLLSLGARKDVFLPWQIAVNLPLLQNIFAERFVSLTYLAVAILLGLIVDHAHRAADRRGEAPRVGPGEHAAGARRARHRRWRGAAAGAIVAAVALVPTATYVAASIPVTIRPVDLPPWFRSVAPHLAAHQVLLVLPLPFVRESTLTWQAVDGMRYAEVGGGGPGSILTRAGKEAKGLAVLYRASFSFTTPTIKPGDVRAVRRALDEWGVTMVVIPDQRHLLAYQQVRSMPFAVALITAATGRRPVHQGDAWTWSALHHTGDSTIPSTGTFSRCTARETSNSVAAIETMNSCVLGDARTLG